MRLLAGRWKGDVGRRTISQARVNSGQLTFITFYFIFIFSIVKKLLMKVECGRERVTISDRTGIFGAINLALIDGLTWVQIFQ